MFSRYAELQSKLSTAQLAAFALIALALNLAATRWLDASYAASAFPVPYYEAQLSFDAQRLKDWYAYLSERGTLGLYLRTQHIDFAFIASVLALHAAALLWVSRLFPGPSRWRQLMVWASLLSALAPLADAVENLISYVMLVNPQDFVPALALAYSSAAAVKFAMFTFAYLAFAAGLVMALIQWGTNKHRARVAA